MISCHFDLKHAFLPAIAANTVHVSCTYTYPPLCLISLYTTAKW